MAGKGQESRMVGLKSAIDDERWTDATDVRAAKLTLLLGRQTAKLTATRLFSIVSCKKV